MFDANSAPRTPEAAWRTTLAVTASLPIGVSVLAAVGLWLRMTEAPTATMDTAPLVFAWLALTIGATLAAWVVWQRMVRPLLPASGFRADPAPADVVGRLQTGLVVCMALVEAAALLGGVLLILGAGPAPALVGMIVVWSAFLVFRPRRGWYGLR